MKKIPSFTIDHIHLLRGIYVSRKDYIGNHTDNYIRYTNERTEPVNRHSDMELYTQSNIWLQLI